MEKEEDQESISDSESSLEDDDKDDEQLETEISELKSKICDNPYDYNTYLLLIDLVRKSGDLIRLREARESMAAKFPLTPELWLQWIRDESGLATDEDQRNFVFNLFEKAINDYVSPDIWLEYVQYSICLLGTTDGLKKIRSIFEEAVSAVGLDVQSGILIWEAFREFEKSVVDITEEEQLNDQYAKIFTLFKRQFSVPLIHMETKFDELKEWVLKMKDIGFDYNIEEVKFVFDKSLIELQKLKPYEDALISSEDNFEDYLKYIEYEEVNGTPPRVQSIYERAILQHCLRSDLWLKYTSYLDSKVKIASLSKKAYERALRNCPWVVDLWVSYIRCLEKFDDNRDNITLVFEKALQAGFTNGSDFKILWLCYLDYLRRKTNFGNEEEVNKLRKCFTTANEHLSNLENADLDFEVLQYLAKIEAKFCKNIENARKIWKESLLSHRSVSGKADMWIEYANLERLFGDETNFRKLLLKGLNSVNDFPETIGQVLIKYEREESTCIDQLEEALKKYEKSMKRITTKRMADETRNVTIKTTNDNQNSSSDMEFKSNRKRKHEESSKSTVQKSEAESSKKPKMNKSVKAEEKQISSPPKFIKPAGESELRNMQTVFISNLNFNTDEDKIKEIFGQFGKINDVRLVRKYNGLSKGFAYVEFESIGGVKEALKNDRMPIDGRPVFISEIGKKSFKYKTGLEANKLFVDNIPVDVTQDDLRNIFKEYGDLSEIRIVTFRNGHSKGKAYVEYKDEIGARSALKANGMLLQDKTITVAISDPPKKNKDDTQKMLGSAFIGAHQAQRAKARIEVPMIPTSLRRQPVAKNGTGDNAQPSSSMSNKDFRNFFKK